MHPQPHHDTRWQLMRDVAVFQAKLFIDGIRDFALIPISLVAGLIDLAQGRHPGHFIQIMDAGRRSEQWIDLFGNHADAQRTSDREVTRHSSDRAQVPKNLDAVVSRLEGVVVEQYQKGGMTAATKRVIDRGLDGLTGKTPKPGNNTAESGSGAAGNSDLNQEKI